MASEASEPRKWLSIRETADALGMSHMTIYRAAMRGEFPALRIGRRLVVPVQVLEDLGADVLASGQVIDVAEKAGAQCRR